MTSPATLDPAGSFDAVRLTLDPAPSVLRTVDGAWWPRSADFAEQLPLLLAHLTPLRGPVHTVALNSTRWSSGTRRLAVADGVVRVGRFSTVDPNLISIGRRGAADLILLIIPPECPPEHAERAMAVAADSADRSRPSAILAAAVSE